MCVLLFEYQGIPVLGSSIRPFKPKIVNFPSLIFEKGKSPGRLYKVSLGFCFNRVYFYRILVMTFKRSEIRIY